MKFYAPPEIQTVTRALALENLLLEDPAGEEGILYCWSGERAVVMGKNQNPWRECNLDFIRDRQCKLARRVSGGGTVYHDPGNLNVSWILPRDTYRAEDMHALFIRVLAKLDVIAESGKGGSLTVNGKKISGSAFCYRKDRVLHHGTLLMDSNLDELQKALSPPAYRIQTHAVDSIPASVANLRDLKPGLNKQIFLDALKTEAEKVFGPLDSLGPVPALDTEAERLASGVWIWDQTPAFLSQLQLPGGKELHFQVRKGKMIECRAGKEEIALSETPHFPDGDFAELESILGMEQGRVAAALVKAGWLHHF